MKLTKKLINILGVTNQNRLNSNRATVFFSLIVRRQAPNAKSKVLTKKVIPTPLVTISIESVRYDFTIHFIYVLLSL